MRTSRGTRWSAVVGVLAAVLAQAPSSHARCGDRVGDLDATEDVALAAIESCPCPDDVGRQPTCVRASVRRAGRRTGLRTACRHDAFRIAMTLACPGPPDLTGTWVLEGDVTSDTCGGGGGFTPVLDIVQTGSSLQAFGFGNQFAGDVTGDTWALHDLVIAPPLSSCPADPTQLYEQTIRIDGVLPNSSGIATLEHRFIKYPLFTPTPACPGCTVVWQGTMTRQSAITR